MTSKSPEMSGMFLALCLEEPIVYGAANTEEGTQAILDEVVLDDLENGLELDCAVVQMTVGAYKIHDHISVYLENCPIYNGVMYTIREMREEIRAGRIPESELQYIADLDESSTEVA